MKVYGGEKPSLEELAHHGVKGMRWGVRREHSTAHEIHSARNRQENRLRELHTANKKLKSSKTSPAQKAAAKRRAASLQKDVLTNEDRVTAARLTTGEKFASVILLGPLGAGLVVAGHINAKRTEKATDKARAAITISERKPGQSSTNAGLKKALGTSEPRKVTTKNRIGQISEPKAPRKS